MNIGTLYSVLDIAATIIEAFCLYVLLMEVLPYENNLRKIFTVFLIQILLTCLMTWMGVPVLFKIVILLMYYMLAYRIAFSTSMSIVGSCAVMFFLCLLVAEDVTIIGCKMLNLKAFVVINGITYGMWYVYLLSHVLLWAAICLLKKWLHPYLKIINNRTFVLPFIGASILLFLVEMFYYTAVEMETLIQLLSCIFAILGIFFVGIFIYIYAEKLGVSEKEKEEEQLKNAILKQQYAYYQDKAKEEEKIRSIYHDMKNHLMVLQCQAGNSEAAQAAIQGLQEQMQEYENYYHTGNDFLDIIIRDKAKIAKEKQIDFNAMIFFEAASFMAPLDISTIFGNALDNAIEASEKCPEDMRFITVKARCVRDMLVIAIENNCSPDVSSDCKTTKKDQFLHGFGLENIKKAIEKYEGQFNIECKKEIFTLKMVIPVP